MYKLCRFATFILFLSVMGVITESWREKLQPDHLKFYWAPLLGVWYFHQKFFVVDMHFLCLFSSLLGDVDRAASVISLGPVSPMLWISGVLQQLNESSGHIWACRSREFRIENLGQAGAIEQIHQPPLKTEKAEAPSHSLPNKQKASCYGTMWGLIFSWEWKQINEMVNFTSEQFSYNKAQLK